MTAEAEESEDTRPAAFVGEHATITDEEVILAIHTLPPAVHNEYTGKVDCSDVRETVSEAGFKHQIERARKHLAVALEIRRSLHAKDEAEIAELRGILAQLDPDTSPEDHDRTARVMHSSGLRRIA